MKYLLICLIPFLLLLSCHTEPVHYKTGRIEDIFAQARKENKKVFVLISDTACGNCDVFQKRIDSVNATTTILNRDYICYKANTSDPALKDITQIVKCPAFPFPYFFDKEGNLLAFGFPNNRNYLVDDLKKIGIDEYVFREMFRLPISTSEYKKLISLNMKAYLLMKEGQTKAAYGLVKESVAIAVYPYNIYLAHRLGEAAGKQDGGWIAQLERPEFTPADKLIYGDLIDNIPFYKGEQVAAQKGNDSINYAFLQKTHECGMIAKGTDYTFSFEFKNTGKKDLVITKAEHSCSCIELKWPNQPVRPGETSYIRGVFHAEQKGRFIREIYVHTVSPDVPMRVVVLTGEVS